MLDNYTQNVQICTSPIMKEDRMCKQIVSL